MTPSQPQDPLLDLSATAESPDGLIEVTVGAFGELRELHLDPRIQRRQDAEALAAAILATVRAAAGTAADLTFDLVRDQLAPGATRAEADLLFGPALRELDRCLGQR